MVQPFQNYQQLAQLAHSYLSPQCFIASLYDSISLNGTVITSLATLSGTPAESGDPNCDGPLPAPTNTKSE